MDNFTGNDLRSFSNFIERFSTFAKTPGEMIEETEKPGGFIPKHGGYRRLKSYIRAEVIYDATLKFTAKYFRPHDRTVSQMVQAARSGKQNLAEGSIASGTSKEIELKLTNIARASLEELLLDYEDLLRNKGLLIWPKTHRYVMRFRELNNDPDANYETFRKAVEHPELEICANAIICLIRVTTYLIKKQVDALERSFLDNGGIRERMLQARLVRRSGS